MISIEEINRCKYMNEVEGDGGDRFGGRGRVMVVVLVKNYIQIV